MSIRVGLISNPKSERNRKGLDSVRRTLDSDPRIIHRQLAPDRPLDDILRELAEARIDILVCNSGDGMVQATMTSLLEKSIFQAPPLLAIWPRGMANMTAADCGLRTRRWSSMEKLLNAAEAGRLDEIKVTRNVLRVDYRDDRPVQRGMFMGGLGIYDAIRICTGSVHKHGFKGEWSHAVTLAGLLLGSMFKGLEAFGIDGHDIRLRVDQGELLDERLLLLLCTTLDHLVLRSRPFWQVEGGPVRFTRIAHPPLGLVRNAWTVLYGSEPRRLPETHYRSVGARRVELWLDEPFTIDGEFFEPLRTRPVRITAFEKLDLLRV
ncbi:MAG: diacylglycerol kinase family protein [Geminicoccaceae bacterium]